MKLSAQEEFGLRCLLAIAKQGEGASLTIAEISEMEGMSTSHVGKILSILRQSGILVSTRGQTGGYALARDPSRIVVRDILEPLGGRLYTTEFCDRHAGVNAACVHETDCLMKPLWANLQAAVDQVLGKYTLADMLHGNIAEPLTALSAAPPPREPLPIR